MHEDFQLLIVFVVAIVAPILAEFTGKLRIPGVVVEIVLGIVVGPHVAGWISEPNALMQDLTHFGMLFLFFLAGMEINFRQIRGRPLRLAALGWVASLALALLLGAVLQATGLVVSSIVMSVALTTTALGTLIPILRDAQAAESRFGRYVIAAGALGEFGPIVLISALLTAGESEGAGTSHRWESLAFLAVFALIAVVAAWIAATLRLEYVSNLLRRKLHTSAQLPVRLAILLLAVLVVLTRQFGLDSVLGAIAAGLVVNLTCQGDAGVAVRHKLEAVGFGVFVPIFFVVSGVKFDVAGLLESPVVMARVPLFMGLFLLVRGVPVLWLYRRELAVRERWAAACFSATALPLVVAVTEIAVESGAMLPTNATALVGAGMISVLIFPALGMAIRGPVAPEQDEGEAAPKDLAIGEAR